MRRHSHAPADYDCPFCRIANGRDGAVSTQADVVVTTDRALVLVAARWWPRSRGHVLVIPRAHAESLYDVEEADLLAVASLSRRAAIAIREVDECDGVSTRQHNEPAGGQDVWHLHTHVFPRRHGDELYRSDALPGWADPVERAARARLLAAHPIWSAPLA